MGKAYIHTMEHSSKMKPHDHSWGMTGSCQP